MTLPPPDRKETRDGRVCPANPELMDFPDVRETMDFRAYPASKEMLVHQAEMEIPARVEEMERTALPACQA